MHGKAPHQGESNRFWVRVDAARLTVVNDGALNRRRAHQPARRSGQRATRWPRGLLLAIAQTGRHRQATVPAGSLSGDQNQEGPRRMNSHTHKLMHTHSHTHSHTHPRLLQAAVATTAVALIALAGCSKEPEMPAATAPDASATPTAATSAATPAANPASAADTTPATHSATANVSDVDVTEHVMTALNQAALLQGIDITVVVSKGDVRLTGQVDNQAQIDEALKIARAADGAHTIHDELTIKP
jgi:hyperosmotically inducible periplasmic protein